MAEIKISKIILSFTEEEQETIKKMGSLIRHITDETDFCHHASCLKCPINKLCLNAPDNDAFANMVIENFQRALE